MKHPILLLASGIVGLAIPCPAALVAHYKFDETTGTTATNQISGGTTGNVGTAVTVGVAGISGTAYRFAGTSAAQNFVDMGNANFFTAINAAGTMSFSAWIKTTDTTDNRNTVVFAGNDTATNIYADMGVSAQPGFVGMATARNRPSGTPNNSVQATGVYGTTAINDGNWHHIAMTVDLAAATLRLYVDGALQNTQTMAIATFPTFNNFEVGRLGRSAPADPFQGDIDDVQVYSNTLSAAEVQYLYANPGTSVPEPGTLALTGLAALALVRRKRSRD